jgi:hypothetical protein
MPAPQLMRGGYRFSDKVTRSRNHGDAADMARAPEEPIKRETDVKSPAAIVGSFGTPRNGAGAVLWTTR